jgi:hypothetical protein
VPGEEIARPSRPSPGKIASSSLIGNPNPPRYPVSPGKRTLTMRLPGPAAAMGDRDDVATRAVERRGGGRPLDHEVRERVEPHVGSDLGHVRVHDDPLAHEATHALGARAFAHGQDIFLGAGESDRDVALMAHELTHVVQQDAGGRASAQAKVTVGGESSPAEAEADAIASQVVSGASPGAAGGVAARTPVQISRLGPFGMGGPSPGPLGGIGQPKDPRLSAFKYFEKWGDKHFSELMKYMEEASLEVPSPHAVWESGSSKSFTYWFAYQLFMDRERAWERLDRTIAPTDTWKVVDTGRDADNPDDPAMANEYHLGVTLEMQEAYRERLRDSLARLVPRYLQEWNRRTLVDHEKRTRGAAAGTEIPEHPESNEPGVGVLKSHPIDRFVLAALTGRLKPDFAEYRRAFPSEAKAREAPGELRKVKFTWQSPNQARRWIRVTDPIDALPEEVARELLGDTELTYLVTDAAPLFGFDLGEHGFVSEYEAQYSKFSDDGTPGGTTDQQILGGPLADTAALNQARGFKSGKVSPAATIQQFDLVIHHLEVMEPKAASWVTLSEEVRQARERVSARKKQIEGSADPGEAEIWNAQAREQLDIVIKAERGLSIATKLFESFPDSREGRDLSWEIASLFVKAAGVSDLVVSARKQLDQANQKLLSFPADWMEAVFRWIRRAVLASQKNARTGKEDEAVKKLGEREAALRVELMRLRDRLLTNPTEVKDEVEKLFKELQDLSIGAAAMRNVDACNEMFVAVTEAKSATGWIRSLGSNPLTGDHGNDRLEALAGRAETFQAQWNIILLRWKAGDKDGAAKALEERAKSAEWKKFFNDVATEIKDQAKYDAWMTFGLLVGIAIVTGFVGVLVEPLAVAALGPVLGFAITVATEAAVFTTMSYFLVEKHPSLEGFGKDFGKNLAVFGILKGVSRAWGALEKLIGVEMKMGEMVASFATLNGIALAEANHEKAGRTGQALTEGEILKISLDNLLFVAAVSIGSKALGPAFGRWRLRGQVGKTMQRFESLHTEVTTLGEQVKASKGSDRASADRLLERQRELLESERVMIEELVQLTGKGWESARKAGMTREQFDGVQAIEGQLADAARGLREAEIIARLEPVSQGQYLSEPGKSFDEAREHFSSDKESKVSEVTRDLATGSRSFEVTSGDGSRMRISERAGLAGEVGAGAERAITAGGEPVAPRELPKIEGDPAKVPTAEQAEANHQAALEMRRLQFEIDANFAALVRAATKAGPDGARYCSHLFGHLSGGGGGASTMNVASRPGAARGGGGERPTELGDTAMIAAGPEPWDTRGSQLMGQPVGGLAGKGLRAQPSQFTSDHTGYARSRDYADAVVATRFDAGVPTLRNATVLERSLENDGTWHVTDARARIKVRTPDGELYMYARTSNLSIGPGEGRRLANEQFGPDVSTQGEYRATLEGDGRIVPGDGPIGRQRGGDVLVSGGGGTGPWNAKHAADLRGRVDFTARESNSPPRMDHIAERYAENQRKLEDPSTSSLEKRRLEQEQKELRAFGGGMFLRNLAPGQAFDNPNIHRRVDEIDTILPSEVVDPAVKSKVWVEFQSGYGNTVRNGKRGKFYHQVVVAHGPDIARKGSVDPTSLEYGAPGALTVEAGGTWRPVVVEGDIVALESFEHPGAGTITGIAMWNAGWIPRIAEPYRARYEKGLAEQAKAASVRTRSPESVGVAGSIHMANRDIPRANVDLAENAHAVNYPSTRAHVTPGRMGRIAEVEGGTGALRTVEDLLVLEATGRVKGMSDWMASKTDLGAAAFVSAADKLKTARTTAATRPTATITIAIDGKISIE